MDETINAGIVCEKCHGSMMRNHFGGLTCLACGREIYQCKRNRFYYCLGLPGGFCPRYRDKCTYAVLKSSHVQQKKFHA